MNEEQPIIEQTETLEQLLSDIEEKSFLSTREVFDLYRQQPAIAQDVERANKEREKIISDLKEKREKNSELSDEEFYKKAMVDFLTPVVRRIIEEYRGIVPPEKLDKVVKLLDPSNIVLSKEGNDIQADSEKGKLMINMDRTLGKTLEEKIAMSMGACIHETFHLMITMLKSVEESIEQGERFMYTVETPEGETTLHFPPGKYGQILSEGFVEKTSSEFAERNGFFYTLNPAYIPYVNLCTYLQTKCPKINTSFLFTKNVEDVVSMMSPEVRESFESIERLAMFNKFEVKEKRTNPELRGIKSDKVISSWMERKDQIVSKKDNNHYRKSSKEQEEVREEPFPKRTPVEVQMYEYIKEKNQMIKQQKAKQEEMEKGTAMTLSSDGSNDSGFTNTIILFSIISIISALLFITLFLSIGR